MKKLLLLSALFISFLTFAQVPQGISYQAIALNGSGNAVVSSNVGIRLSILDNSASGAVLYTETHTAVTNAQGLFNLVIGQGTPTVGVFSALKWETNAKYLKVEMDAAGGTSYVLVGTTQLLSVPYALYAGKVDAANITGGPDVNGAITEWYSSSFMTSTHAYVYSQGVELADYDTPPNNYAWYSTPITGTPFMKSQNSFLTTTNAYIFGPATADPNGVSSWHTYPISGTPININSAGALFTLAVTSTNAYMFHYNYDTATLDWNSTPISGDIVEITDHAYYTFGILTSTNAYVFYNNAWTSTAISGTPLKIKYSRGGILVLTSTNAYLYGPNVYDLNNNAAPVMSWHNIAMPSAPVLD